jgi:hypothetical protein
MREHIRNELPYPAGKHSAGNKGEVIRHNVAGKVLQQKDEKIKPDEVKNSVIKGILEWSS